MFSKASIARLVQHIVTAFPKMSGDKMAAILLTYTHPHLFKMRKSISNRKINRRVYPHSSARQQARYARQIAAGQLSMEGVTRV